MTVVFQERTRGHEPTAHFSLDVSESSRTYVLYDTDALSPGFTLPPEDATLQDKVRELIGHTESGSDGRLLRTPPKCDPRFKSLFAEDVMVRVPQGEGYLAATADGTGLAVKPVAGHAWYHGYEFDVKFRARPYPLAPDSRMHRLSLNFVDEDGVSRKLNYYKEWLRYAHYVPQARDSFISATIGAAMKFDAPGESKVHNSPYTGVPSFVVPDVDILFNWYHVPIRYLDSANSYLVKYRGYVNQAAFNGWPRASLLYLGAKTTNTYTPPVFRARPQGEAVHAGTFAAEKLVDLQLHLVRTIRSTPAPPPPADLPNPNWIAEGHNLMPHLLTRRFFYAHADFPDTDKSKWVPSYLSVPFEVLFQDPDSGAIVSA
jgi:hypothetical protein